MQMSGTVELDGRTENINSGNVLLRGCRLKNTTFVEGVVIYSGRTDQSFYRVLLSHSGDDTKLMMNNGRAPYKRSLTEQLTNRFLSHLQQ